MTLKTCENAQCKLGLNLTRTSSTLRKTSSVAIKDMCVLVVDTLNTRSDINVHYVIHQNIL